MTSIRSRIILTASLTVAAALILVCFITANMNMEVATSIAKDSIEETAIIASDRAKWEISSYLNIAQDIGGISPLTDPSMSDEAKKSILANRAEYYGLERCNLIDLEGNGIDGNTYSDREYFQHAIKGETWVSDPLVSKVTGKLTVIVAAPLWEGGVTGSKVAGCVYVVPHEEFLNDIIRSIKISENSTAYMINSSGSTIAAIDMEIVKSGENIQTLAETDPGYAEMAALHEKILAGENGVDITERAGQKIIAGYSPIADSNGWSLVVYAPKADFLGKAYQGIAVCITITIAAIIVSVILSVRLGRSIGNPIKSCTDRIISLSEGDLTSPVPAVKAKDETGMLADATARLVSDLNTIIGDISGNLNAMANGDLGIDCRMNEARYCGDLHAIVEAIAKINSDLNHTMGQINTSADQVSTGSEQVSGSAQSLSQGATEQASSIQELAATIHTISDQINATYSNCEKGRTLVEETVTCVKTASNDMSRLTEAMKDISDASAEISKINKEIEDIAFQTNILALNAAVEAARAGEAGKGFAVVADEVRSLASKSSQAAQETNLLIEKALAAAENGKVITAETSGAVSGVAERSDSVKDIVESIADACGVQADVINQISAGIEQISGVVQSNTATAEQSAAASEELSGQAMLLKKLVGSFKLKK
ncbi:MAG: methyl-accepting chemotaxis protein [Huintestinicola sp.]